MTLSLHILRQAIEDVLRFELGLPLEGVPFPSQEEEYLEALEYILRYPSLSKRLKYKNKEEWLEEVSSVVC